MTTESESLDPWFFEDIELRSEASARKLLEAAALYEKALGSVTQEPYAAYLKDNIHDIKVLEQMVTAVRCYCREANLAHLMRKYVARGETIPQALVDRFEAIMRIDIDNQNKGYAPYVSGPTAEDMLRLFREDPARWVTDYLPYR